MNRRDRQAGWKGRMLAVGAVLAASLGLAGQSYAENVKFTCNDSNYPSFESCSVFTNAVTIRENGKEIKGHLVNNYQCVKGVCTNNMHVPPKSYPYTCSMEDLACFCATVKPDCKTGWTRK